MSPATSNKKLLETLNEIKTGNIEEVAKKFSIPLDVLKKARQAKRSDILSDFYPYRTRTKRKIYEERKTLLQIELVKLHRWLQETDQKLVIVFEGRDAAGKGGSIKRFTDHLNPRAARVVALQKPTEKERGEWYFQRYIQKLPTAGEIVFFDRSWYNRAGVEQVMGFCTPEENNIFYKQVNEFENMLIDSGVNLVKFWFSISREEQLRRFFIRTTDPLKQWKLSPMDVESLERWDQYTEAKLKMLRKTDIPESPWIIVRSDDKKRARLNAMRYLLEQFDYSDKNHHSIIPLDHSLVGRPRDIYSKEELPL